MKEENEEKEEKEEKETKGERLLRDIYGQLLIPQRSVYLEQAGQELEKVVDEVLSECRDALSASEYEAWREKFYKVAFCAQENGFLAGFRYSVDLLEGEGREHVQRKGEKHV
ncbi:MAG: hypothetical protein ACI4EO_03435 [Blautia sp.]